MTRHPTSRARHRAARPPSTPLSHALGTSAARRSLGAIVSSGLVVTMAATSATATRSGADLPDIDSSAVTRAALRALVTTPTVTVPSDVVWDVDAVATATASAPPVAAPPVPPAPPAPVVDRSSDAASRTATRPAPGPAPASPTPAETAAPAPAAPAPAAPAASGQAVVDLARTFLGVPYVWGGTTPAGFDCSGFTQYVYAAFGISLPRTSSAQATVGTRVSAADARPGDLVTWPGHVGIYTGNGNNIAARQPGTPLTEGPIYNSSPVFIRVT